MADLFTNSYRPYVRISERMSCALAIAHKIADTPRPQREANGIALKFGNALEPVVVSELRDRGLSVAFDGDNQLEVATANPYSNGHPDGIVWAPFESNEWPYWLKMNLPKSAIERFNNNECMMLEVKTMNAGAYSTFVKHGLSADPLLAKYIGQIQGYLTAMNRRGDYELWPDGAINPVTGDEHLGSDSFRKFLLDNHLAAPTSCLVVVLGTENKRIAFDVIEWDEDVFEARNPALISMIDNLKAGVFPEPEYDGKAQECYWCPFKDHCPAIQKEKEETSLDDLLDSIPTASPADDGVVHRIAEAYVMNREEIKQLEHQQDELKAEFKREFGNTQIKTDTYSVSYVEEKGRSMVDIPALKDIARELGFEIPMTRAKSSERMRVNVLKGPTADR